MNQPKILLAISALVVAALACSVDMPEVTTDVKTGPSSDYQIYVPKIGEGITEAEIDLIFAAGDIYIAPGEENGLIRGTATYNVADLQPQVEINANQVKIQTGNLAIEGIPSFETKIENTWELYLSDDPINLTLKAGAYNGEIELGGLNISRLHIADGASDVDLTFSQPNQTELRTFHYETGASNVDLSMLGNANIRTMIFESGAGNYDLDFSGAIQQDASVYVQSGLSSMTIHVPAGLNASVTIEGGLTNISTRGNWVQSGSQYNLSGDGPTLTFIIEMSAGNLVLRSD